MEKSLCFFPVVGLLIGIIISLIYVLTESFLPEAASASIIIVALILLTGGLHLDGVADTFDAIASRKDRKGKLKVMRDSHIGSLGAAAIFCALFLKFAALISIPASSLVRALLLAPLLSRWCLTGACILSSYAGRTNGKARLFMKICNPRSLIGPTAFTILISVILFKWQGMLIFFLVGTSSFIIIKRFERAFGGLTGDTLGTLNESVEILSLFLAAILI